MKQLRIRGKALTTLGMSVIATGMSLALAAPAEANRDVGWQYSPDAGAKGYFDADVAG